MLRTDPATYPRWKVEVDLVGALSARTVEYKFVVLDRESVAQRWEGFDGNRAVRLFQGERPGVAHFGCAVEAAVPAWDPVDWQREWKRSRHENGRKRDLLKLVAEDNRRRVARALSGSVLSPVWRLCPAVE